MLPLPQVLAELSTGQAHSDRYSTVLYSREGRLLGASIAKDEQWRFAASALLPPAYVDAVLQFEDRRFYWHSGVSLPAVLRAAWQNYRAEKVVSGASTISMQVIRLAISSEAETARPRTLRVKLWESLLALRLEQRYSKQQILQLYAALVPMGGNVVGVEAAAWRYFQQSFSQLSQAQYALLAVLPNNPSVLRPDANESLRHSLKAKRDRLLQRLLYVGKISADQLSLAIAEPLPQRPQKLPRDAIHVLQQQLKLGRNLHSTLDHRLQQQVGAILARHQRLLQGNAIYNSAALVVDTYSGEVLAYHGNNPEAEMEHDLYVDIVRAPRSSGSLLKPLLYASMLEAGEILPHSIIPDVPLRYAGFSPENFLRRYMGVVAADQAIFQSLNVPSVWMLRAYGIHRFSQDLKSLGLSHITRPADDYGLPLILGGAEVSLWDITGLYAALGRSLSPKIQEALQEDIEFDSPFFYPKLLQDESGRRFQARLALGSIYLMMEAMSQVQRPGLENYWEHFASAQKIAWKTGTSYGNRDAWAIGLTPRYTVGVWVGNAKGTGRSNLVGAQVAGPILFEIFRSLPQQHHQPPWFVRPVLNAQRKSALVQVEVCAESGMRSAGNCPDDLSWVEAPPQGSSSPLDRYYQAVHLSGDGQFQVYKGSSAAQQLGVRSEYRFVLPPQMEHYYRFYRLQYRALPPFIDGPVQSHAKANMALIEPQLGSRIYLPYELGGERQKLVVRVVHRQAGSRIHWHMGQDYLGFTQDDGINSIQQFSLEPPSGPLQLTLLDENGQRLELHYEILAREDL